MNHTLKTHYHFIRRKIAGRSRPENKVFGREMVFCMGIKHVALSLDTGQNFWARPGPARIKIFFKSKINFIFSII